ncbi:ClpXP protease specificity-enhancing factor [Aliidiomarina iranensis]|uniref:ClpXP protease specificity-enhancing factor n=1 Tax=Aliidiomarina iranensis TaxID=1434071 RepID=A0A432W2R5_9GAMM|nr:ClpXP protease specificity-enhancing factor [Aliidiomarina iranensis]RUO23509.1 ClpXP protease specificity-enhancing factor [Aliidiomarina iranensis]
MTPKRPYILRALYEWLVENDLTPHLVVDAEYPRVEVPQQFVQDGQIVLNVAPGAVQNMLMANEEVSFRTRFNGQDQRIILPMGALLAIYARENGAGTIFEPEDAYIAAADKDGGSEGLVPVETTDTDINSEAPETTEKPKKGPKLTVVK